MNQIKIAEHFNEFSHIKTSPLYATLSAWIATQSNMLQIVQNIPLKKSPRTILFAAIHFLLLKGIKHPLADFYPSLGGQLKLSSENKPILCATFADFFKQYKYEIINLLHNNTQTNEAKRAMALLPAFSKIIQYENSAELSLIEIGTSAGLLLNLDQYNYQLNDFVIYNSKLPPILKTKWHGPLPKNVSNHFIKIKHKIGIDINPLNLEDENVKLWLKALIWPEQTDRLENFEFVCEVMKNNKHNLTIFTGKFEEYLANILDLCKDTEVICFMCVWVLYQFSEAEKNQLDDTLSLIAKKNKQTIYFIHDDWDLHNTLDSNNIFLRRYFSDGTYHSEKVAETHHHGTWINSYL